MADVQADPSENVNLAASPEHAETVARLSGLLDAHAANSVEVPESWTVRVESKQKGQGMALRQRLRDVAIK